MKNYSEYEVKLTTEQSWFGSECSEADGVQISNRLSQMIAERFPGITIYQHHDMGKFSRITGPTPDIIDEIDKWIDENWTSACVL